MRNMRAVIVPGLLFAGLLLSSAGCAAECAPAVEDGWIRAGPPSMPVRAGFGTIRNACPAPLVITGVRSDAFGSAMLHETTDVDGVSRMRMVGELVVPAGGAVELAPGGLHLMLGEPSRDLEQGDAIVIEFRRRDGRPLLGAFDVR